VGGVTISIADNADGIPESIQTKLFDPFFTTKPIGKGTGLGLSISHQIITEKHQGKIEFYSTVGQGTEFAVQIPMKQV
jgi:signal transduction histidine kinase